MPKPLVSIVSITYNQEKYIAEALESFVSQKTNFAFEAIIADDASTDKTPEIIQEYAEKYPDIIKPILRKKNVGVSENLYDALRHASGTYVALCEGDDFLTDPHKLQLQADFLESHPDYAVSFHPVRVFFEDQSQPDSIFPDPNTVSDCSVDELLRHNFIQTNTAMYRRQNYDKLPPDILPLDWYLHLYHASFGKIGFVNKTMAAYRRHAGGLWWDSEKNLNELLKRHGSAMMGLYFESWKLFNDDFPKVQIIFYRASDLLNKMAAIDKKEGSQLVAQALQTNPEIVVPLIEYQSEELAEREKTIHVREETIDTQDETLKEAHHTNEEISSELQQIKQSKSWKLARAVAVGSHQVRRPLHKNGAAKRKRRQ